MTELPDVPSWAVNVPPTAGVHPASLGGPAPTRPFSATDLLQIGADFIEAFLRHVVEAVAGVFLPGIAAFQQLHDWGLLVVGGIANAANMIQQIIDNIVNAVNYLGEWLTEMNPLSAVAEAILGLLGIGTNAQRGVSDLDARVRALEGSTANAIVLDFSAPASATMADLGFTVATSGGGAGRMGPNGAGALVWTPSGGGSRTELARYDEESLSADVCRLEWVLSSTPDKPLTGGTTPYTFVLARVEDDSFDNFVRVRIAHDEVRVQAAVAGTVTNIGPAWAGSPRAGDQFEWLLGDTGNGGHHVMKRNGSIILDFTETTSVSGSNYRHIGVGMSTGPRSFGGVAQQGIPAGLAVLTATEVL